MVTARANRPFRRVRAGVCAALIALTPLASCGGGTDPEGTPRRIAREIDQTLTTVAQNELARDPELATRLGLPEDAVGFPFNRYLTDRSQAAYERARLSRMETRDLLVRVPRPAPGSALARHLDTLIAAYETAETLFMAGHGATGLGASYPYAADHLRGAWIDVPLLLTLHHPMQSPEDARAYVSRLAQFADAIEDERRRMEADAAAGVVPPAPILRRMSAALDAMGPKAADTNLAAGPAPVGGATSRPAAPAPGPVATASAEAQSASPIVRNFENLTAGIPGLDPAERESLIADVRSLESEAVQPAYAAFALSLDQLANTAPELPGIWQVPDGEAYYAAALRAHTGDAASPGGLHERGRREVEALLADLDRALAGLGLTEGTPAERLAFIAAQPEQLYPDTEEGRTALVGRLSEHAARALPRLSDQFDIAIPSLPSLRPASELHATMPAFARYLPARTDGSAPAQLAIDLGQMADWPDFRLAAQMSENAVPGRHLAVSVTGADAGLPLIRQLVSDLAYTEGWAAYAATLADELGLYSEDPLSRIGYLQSRLLHAARMVADTGIHQERWGRDQAIAWLSTTTGVSEAFAAEEVDRYTVWPGQAAAGWLGRSRILDLRDRAIRVLGPRFDARAFHRVILTGGPRPLDMVEDDVTRWYSAQLD